MGARAARITREEFLTPPEFRGLDSDRAPGRPGRRGTDRADPLRRARPAWGRCYQQIPVRLMPAVRRSTPSRPSLLYLINLTAGLMDGDGHLIEITARAGTRAVVTGQSATRVHPAVASYATQQWAVEVEDDACLVVLPGPGDPVPGLPLLPARPRRARPARPADLGRHLAARPLRPRRAVRAVPVRADRPGLRGPSRRPAGLPRPLPLGRPLDRRGGRLVLRRSAGLRQPVRRRADARRPLPEAGPDVRRVGLPARHRRLLHAMVRPPGGRHGRPRADRPAPGRRWTIGPGGPALAPRLERPRPQPLVLDAGAESAGSDDLGLVPNSCSQGKDGSRRHGKSVVPSPAMDSRRLL